MFFLSLGILLNINFNLSFQTLFLFLFFGLLSILILVEFLLKKNKFFKINILEFQALKVDLKSRRVTNSGVEIKLTKQEFDLLGFLLINSGNIVSKNELLEEIWEILYPSEEDENKVEVYIGYLRKKLKPFNLDGHIHTVRGFGYRWNN